MSNNKQITKTIGSLSPKKSNGQQIDKKFIQMALRIAQGPYTIKQLQQNAIFVNLHMCGVKNQLYVDLLLQKILFAV